ncbi:hypothetical protein DPMN_121201 [Dreissena polymorpha]|uniref:Uncharacterized protein n=1 Tax=Dreissena polymorpha TaxID=45954 RepID=A0A9D4GQ24_DREPO|nr:hypothetical protein DPMN_121201 [Dreissena polymorpha]
MKRFSLYVSSSFAPSALAGLWHLEPDHFEKSDDGPGSSAIGYTTLEPRPGELP